MADLSKLNLGNVAGLQPGGITNQNLLPTQLRTTTPPPVSPITKQPVTSFGSKATTTNNAMAPGGVDTNYFLNPGENFDDYRRRITAYNDSKNALQTPGGSLVATDGKGNALASTGFNIDVSGPVSSDIFSNTPSKGDVKNSRKSYADYVQGLSEATQYSPEYVKALEGVQASKLRGAELTSNFYTGNNLPGDTVGYAQGFTTKESALNDIRGLAAQQALQVQELVRSGNIEAAKALVDAYAPTSVSPGNSLVSPVSGDVTFGGAAAYSDYQAQQTYFNLAQTFPDANIPAYDPNLTGQQNLQMAQSLASTSPSFQSRNLVQVALPGGGISFVNRNQLQTGPDGMLSIISSGDAAQADGYKAAIGKLTDQAAQIGQAINTADALFPQLLQVVKKAGVNDYSSPLANQLQQAVNKKLIGSGDYASYNALLASLQATYSQILSRGYQPTESTRKEADALVSGTIGYKALQKLYGTLKQEGETIRKGIERERQTTVGKLNGVYSKAQPLSSFQNGGGTSGGTGSGSVWDF